MKKIHLLISVISVFALSFAACGGGGGGQKTYSISGTVTLNGSGYAGVTVDLSGDNTGSAVTDSSGGYSFTGLSDGYYTLTPSLSNQTLTPDSRDLNVSGSSIADADFTVDTHAISGQVTLNSVGYENAAVTLSGSAAAADSTDAFGFYSFTGLLNGSYTVTPAVSGQTLSPADSTVALSGADLTGNDFALDTYSISGHVTYNGAGESGVTLTLPGSAAGSSATDGSGDYSLTGLLNGTYTVTPVLYDQTFAPASSTVTISSASNASVDFSIPQMIWFVDVDSPTATPDGLSWGTAFMNPQNGSDMAATGDQVWVADGTYASMDTGDRAMPVLAMKDNVEYYGGFNGAETDLADRDWEANPTILTGDIGTQGDMSDNTIHVVTGADGSVLDGFTVTKGNAYVSAYNNPDNKGGGMSNVGASPTVVNCVFLENSAFQNGGGMYNQNSAPTVSHCSFIGNFNIPSINANSGGGMGNENAAPVIRDCLFDGNSAFDGGGIGNEQCPPVVIDRCVFTGNQASSDGGGIYSELSTTPEVTNCLFQGNSASRWGGGIGSNYSSSIITNCTFTGNTASDGRGVYNFYNGTPVVSNSILWDGGSEAAWLSAPLTVHYSDVQGGYAGTGNIDADPLFVDAANDDYQLSSTSPCIDTGDNSAVTTSYDLAGSARIVDGDGLNTAEVDMGAYEYQP